MGASKPLLACSATKASDPRCIVHDTITKGWRIGYVKQRGIMPKDGPLDGKSNFPILLTIHGVIGEPQGSTFELFEVSSHYSLTMPAPIGNGTLKPPIYTAVAEAAITVCVRQ